MAQDQPVLLDDERVLHLEWLEHVTAYPLREILSRDSLDDLGEQEVAEVRVKVLLAGREVEIALAELEAAEERRPDSFTRATQSRRPQTTVGASTPPLREGILRSSTPCTVRRTRCSRQGIG